MLFILTTMALAAGCGSTPRASSYTIRVEDRTIVARSFKIQGDWISIEPMGRTSTVVVPMRSLVSIEQNSK